MNSLAKKLVAEFLGVALFLTSIVGATLSSADLPRVSLAITLGLMILLTAGISGGHLNPAVSLYFLARRAMNFGEFAGYVAAQLLGGFAGAMLGTLLWAKSFNLVIDLANKATPAMVTGELVATAGLVWLVGTLARTNRGALIPAAVGLWVAAAAGFTATGAQANPAVAFGLVFHPASAQSLGTAGVLMLAQFAGALFAVILVNLFDEQPAKTKK